MPKVMRCGVRPPSKRSSRRCRVATPMPDRRSALVAAVRRDLAAARGNARAALAAAERRLAVARERGATLAARRPSAIDELTAARETGRIEADQRFARESAPLARALYTLATSELLAPVNAMWSGWQPSAAPPNGQAPGLYRVGSVAVGRPLPALVPLLDHAHLELSGPDPAALDGVITGLLLRVLGSAPPGAVRMHVYDPELLGGSLVGLAPLCGPELLTFVGPGGLTDLLDDIAEQIRRIHESVLAGEFSSLADLAAETGRRPEPWRIVVLLGTEVGVAQSHSGGPPGSDRHAVDGLAFDGRAAAPTPDMPPAVELTAAQRAQLDRILRTGVACGVHVVSRGRYAGRGAVERIMVRTDGTARTTVHGGLIVTLDPAP